MKRLFSCLLVVLMGWMVLKVFAESNDKDEPSTRTPIKIEGHEAAPEFEDITAWVNSKPLKMKDLRGKVVVVHFMAFG
jgi:hypothetical protein